MQKNSKVKKSKGIFVLKFIKDLFLVTRFIRMMPWVMMKVRHKVPEPNRRPHVFTSSGLPSLDCKGFYSGTHSSSLPGVFCTYRGINACLALLERASDQSQSSMLMFLDFSDSSGVHVCAMTLTLTLWGRTDSSRTLSLSQRVFICIHSSDSGWQTSAPPQTSAHQNSAWDSSSNFTQICLFSLRINSAVPSVVAHLWLC